MGSLTCLRISGTVLAVVDLLFGLYILGFYANIQYEKYHCYWAHGIRSCDFYLHETNHSTRTIVGIVTGFFSMICSIVLLFAFIKRAPRLAWAWVLKALVIIGINIYYLSDWLVKRGRYYHSYWNPDEYSEESWFIMQGAVELVTQIIISLVFCLVNGFFSYKQRRHVRALKAAESEI